LEVNRLFYAIWDYYKPYLLECKGHLTAEHIAFYQKRNLDLARYTSTESSFIEQKKVVQADLGHLYAMDLMTTLYYRMQVSPQIRSIPIQYWAQLQMSVKSFLDGLEAFIMENAQTV
jgi:hypothetical protein